MDDYVVFTKRATWSLWIFFIFCFSVCADVDNNKCRRPEVTSPRPPLFAYQCTSTIDVTVYHCLYRQEIRCSRVNYSNCLKEIFKYTHVGKPIHQYSDVTQNCIEAFNSTKFKDKYGASYNYKNNVPVTYEPADNIANRTVTISLTTHNTKVELGSNRIELRSGTVCKYTTGFCHDEKENIDVLWVVQDISDKCSHNKKLNVSDLYYFTLNEKRYAILEWDGKHFPLELTNKTKRCGVSETWSSIQENLIVVEGILPSAKNNTLDPTDYLEFYFENKQDLYDFLFETCIVDLQSANPNPQLDMLLKKSFRANLKLRDDDDKFNKLNDQMRRLWTIVEISAYVIAVIILCLMGVIGILVYIILKRYSAVVSYGSTRPSLPNVPTYIRNAYEYITSEYNINSVYDEKYCQLPTNHNKESSRGSNNKHF